MFGKISKWAKKKLKQADKAVKEAIKNVDKLLKVEVHDFNPNKLTKILDAVTDQIDRAADKIRKAKKLDGKMADKIRDAVKDIKKSVLESTKNLGSWKDGKFHSSDQFAGVINELNQMKEDLEKIKRVKDPGGRISDAIRDTMRKIEDIEMLKHAAGALSRVGAPSLKEIAQDAAGAVDAVARSGRWLDKVSQLAQKGAQLGKAQIDGVKKAGADLAAKGEATAKALAASELSDAEQLSELRDLENGLRRAAREIDQIDGEVRDNLNGVERALNKAADAVAAQAAELRADLEAAGRLADVVEAGMAEAYEALENGAAKADAALARVVEDALRVADVEALAKQIAKIAPGAVDLSRATLEGCADLAGVAVEDITPEMARVFQAMSPEAIAGFGAAAALLVADAAGEAVAGVEAATAYMADLAEGLGAFATDLGAYFEALLMNAVRDAAEMIMEDVFEPLLDEAGRSLGTMDDQLLAFVEDGVAGAMQDAVALSGPGTLALAEQATGALGGALPDKAIEAMRANLGWMTGDETNDDPIEAGAFLDSGPVDFGVDLSGYLYGGATGTAKVADVSGKVETGLSIDLLNSDLLDGDVFMDGYFASTAALSTPFSTESPFSIEGSYTLTQSVGAFGSAALGEISATDLEAAVESALTLKLDVSKLTGGAFDIGALSASVSFGRSLGWVIDAAEDDPEGVFDAEVDTISEFFQFGVAASNEFAVVDAGRAEAGLGVKLAATAGLSHSWYESADAAALNDYLRSLIDEAEAARANDNWEGEHFLFA